MAAAYQNPQDPEAYPATNSSSTTGASCSAKDAEARKIKPNRALLYLRNRARGTATNVTVVFITFVLSTLIVHRCYSLWASHRRWINAPITYMHRQCPAPEYPILDLSTATTSSTNNNDKTNNQKKQRQPKICMTTLTDQKSPSKFQRFMRWRNYDGILDLTWNNKKRYADKHGYHLHDGSIHIDTSRPPAWSKVKAVQYLLQNKQLACDWVMWTDADTVIMNSRIAVTDFLPAADSPHDLLVASDKGGGYNSGVFLFRNTAWSHGWLEQWWSMKGFVRPPGLSLSGDNAAMKALLANMHKDKTFDAHVLSPPRCTFNSFAHFLTLGQSIKILDHLEEQDWYLDNEHYHKGDFIAHIPGVDNKVEALKLLLQEAK